MGQRTSGDQDCGEKTRDRIASPTGDTKPTVRTKVDHQEHQCMEDSSDSSDSSVPEGEAAAEKLQDSAGIFAVQMGPWESYRETYITVYFDLPQQANRAITSGLFLDGQLQPCTKFNLNCVLRRCTRCWAWGHYRAACISRGRCQRCASDSNHTHKRCGAAVKCCNCNGPHTYWASECPVKVAELKRLRELEAKAYPYFRTEEYRPGYSTSMGPEKETHSARFGNSAPASCDSHGEPKPAKRRKSDREPLATVTANQLREATH